MCPYKKGEFERTEAKYYENLVKIQNENLDLSKEVSKLKAELALAVKPHFIEIRVRRTHYNTRWGNSGDNDILLESSIDLSIGLTNQIRSIVQEVTKKLKIVFINEYKGDYIRAGQIHGANTHAKLILGKLKKKFWVSKSYMETLLENAANDERSVDSLYEAITKKPDKDTYW